MLAGYYQLADGESHKLSVDGSIPSPAIKQLAADSP